MSGTINTSTHKKYIPQKNMTILIKSNNDHSFGIISEINTDNMVIALLDRCGKITIDISSDWEPFDILNPKILHYYYDTFVGKNVTDIFVNHYEAYKKKYIKQ